MTKKKKKKDCALLPPLCTHEELVWHQEIGWDPQRSRQRWGGGQKKCISLGIGPHKLVCRARRRRLRSSPCVRRSCHASDGCSGDGCWGCGLAGVGGMKPPPPRQGRGERRPLERGRGAAGEERESCLSQLFCFPFLLSKISRRVSLTRR